MATDRERAGQVWRDAYGAYLTHRAEPGPRSHNEAAAVIERALSPTDEEREAMGEVVEAAKRARKRLSYFAVAGTPELEAVEAIDAALARLDAVTGGRGDGE